MKRNEFLIETDKGHVTVSVEQDRTVELQDYAPNIMLANSRKEFWNLVKSFFKTESSAKQALVSILRGGAVKVRHDRKEAIILGLEQYSHSGVVLALCGRGNFPDRQWDVTPIVGFVAVRDYRKSPISFEKAIELAEKEIEIANMIFAGDCWSVWIKAGTVQESAVGILGRQNVRSVVESLLSENGLEAKNCDLSLQM